MIDPRDRAKAIVTLMSIQSPDGKIDIDLLTQELNRMQQDGFKAGKEEESEKLTDYIDRILKNEAAALDEIQAIKKALGVFDEDPCSGYITFGTIEDTMKCIENFKETANKYLYKY